MTPRCLHDSQVPHDPLVPPQARPILCAVALPCHSAPGCPPETKLWFLALDKRHFLWGLGVRGAEPGPAPSGLPGPFTGECLPTEGPVGAACPVLSIPTPFPAPACPVPSHKSIPDPDPIPAQTPTAALTRPHPIPTPTPSLSPPCPHPSPKWQRVWPALYPDCCTQHRGLAGRAWGPGAGAKELGAPREPVWPCGHLCAPASVHPGLWPGASFPRTESAVVTHCPQPASHWGLPAHTAQLPCPPTCAGPHISTQAGPHPGPAPHPTSPQAPEVLGATPDPLVQAG